MENAKRARVTPVSLSKRALRKIQRGASKGQQAEAITQWFRDVYHGVETALLPNSFYQRYAERAGLVTSALRRAHTTKLAKG